MATLHYPSEASVPYPILISNERLFALDDLIAKYLPLLANEQESEWILEFRRDFENLSSGTKVSEAEIEQNRQYFERHVAPRRLDRQKTIVLTLRNKKRLSVESFREASFHPELTNEVATGFSLELTYRPYRVKISASRGMWEKMEMSVAPSSSSIAQEFFGEIRSWTASVSSPWWLRAWRALTPFGTMMAWLLWLSLSLIAVAPTQTDSSKAYYEEKAHQLLRTGVNADNERQAIEILLALESDYKYGSPLPHQRSARLLVLVAGGFLFCCVLSAPPGLTIGLAGGERRIIYWRWWLRFLSITFPAYLASIFIWPRIGDLLRALLK